MAGSGGNTVKMTETIPSDSKPITIQLTCKDCVFFSREAYYSDGKNRYPCSKLGRLSNQFPCPTFRVDPYSLDFMDSNILSFAKILASLPANKMSVLAAVVLQEYNTRKNGFNFGQTVYIRVFSEDYISNWAVAKILKVDDKWIYLQGKRDFRARVQHSSVLRVSDWEKHRAKLASQGRFTDPSLNKYIKMNNIGLKIKNSSMVTIDEFGFALQDETVIRTDLNGKTPTTDINTTPEIASLPRKRGRPRKIST